MKINIKEFMDKIENNEFKQDHFEISKDDLLQSDSWVLEQAKAILDKDEELSQVMIHVADEEFDIDFYLETGVINLPFDDAKKVTHFFEDEEIVDTKIYLSTRCDYLNASKFHIDLISENKLENDEMKKTLDIMKENYQTSLENFNKKDESETEEK
ncbi:hypothetical protein FC72_GL000818 [Companilactobacillus tucceti DSM 20183]|uniref:Uncharacterized protein n=1 Tax=Companilactobacillus tucceti DSM 20183 TaxID=1423811 RepID=A0A0R1IXE5_9LACO|nr:hypothetical protein [Companilactobacillus tucceti]KRK63933.1 hypothetical protein FC72_GL000818 [Companilactobacillus tucceti DSM 20183]